MVYIVLCAIGYWRIRVSTEQGPSVIILYVYTGQKEGGLPVKVAGPKAGDNGYNGNYVEADSICVNRGYYLNLTGLDELC